MKFSERILEQVANQEVFQEADGIRFHRLGDGVFEISFGDHSVLLSTDAGLDLSFRLAEFMAVMEKPARDGEWRAC